MKPTTEILVNLSKNSSKNKDEIFTRLYRYMLRPDLYFIAYKNLYANMSSSVISKRNSLVLFFLC